jgi:hypothetical protein
MINTFITKLIKLLMIQIVEKSNILITFKKLIYSLLRFNFV